MFTVIACVCLFFYQLRLDRLTIFVENIAKRLPAGEYEIVFTL